MGARGCCHQRVEGATSWHSENAADMLTKFLGATPLDWFLTSIGYVFRFEDRTMTEAKYNPNVCVESGHRQVA